MEDPGVAAGDAYEITFFGCWGKSYVLINLKIHLSSGNT
jgi:hypothetical protein